MEPQIPLPEVQDHLFMGGTGYSRIHQIKNPAHTEVHQECPVFQRNHNELTAARYAFDGLRDYTA